MNKSASDLPKFPLETIRDVSDDMELCDSVSDISSITHNASALSSSVAGASVAPSCSSAAANLSVVEARSVLSPMMRSLKDEIKKHIEDTIKNQLEESILMTAKEAKQTPRKTSSPVRRSPRLAAEKEYEEDLEDTIISGVNFANVGEKMREAAAGAVARSALGDVTNNAKARHKERVEEAASPMLPRREADDDNSNKENPPTTPKSAMKAPSSSRTETPPLSELEKTLGLNSDSPLLFGCDSPRRCSTSRRPAAPGTVKRSARRTTMLQPELNQSLLAARQSFSIPNEDTVPLLRRSKRISMLQPPPPPQPMGPPAPPGPRVHPLEVRSHWSAKDQQEHNGLILGILNTANIGMLQKLPGIGPKTAIKLHTQRDFQNGFQSVEDLKNIEGLPKSFFEKFCIKNQIVLE